MFLCRPVFTCCPEGNIQLFEHASGAGIGIQGINLSLSSSVEESV